MIGECLWYRHHLQRMYIICKALKTHALFNCPTYSTQNERNAVARYLNENDQNGNAEADDGRVGQILAVQATSLRTCEDHKRNA